MGDTERILILSTNPAANAIASETSANFEVTRLARAFTAAGISAQSLASEKK
jgi:hypothetical protein